MGFRADGYEWKVSLAERSHRQGKRAVVFHNLSDRLRAYRVTEVDAEEVDSQETLDAMDDAALMTLFQRSQPYDWPRDGKAEEGHVGHKPTPREMDV